MSTATLQSIIHKNLEMLKASARWDPKFPSEEQKRDRVKLRKKVLSMYKADKVFLDRIFPGDISWFHYYEP